MLDPLRAEFIWRELRYAEALETAVVAQDSAFAAQARALRIVEAALGAQARELDRVQQEVVRYSALADAYERRLRRKIRWQRVKLLGAPALTAAAGFLVGRQL